MQKLNKGLWITIFSVALPVLMQFFFIRYMSYNVDKEDYGNFVLLQTLIAGLSTILLQMPSHSFDRFYNQSEDKITIINEFRTLLIFINIVSAFIIFLYSLFMQKFDFQVLLIVYLYFALINNYTLNQKIFLLNLERGKFFYLKILEGISKFIMPIVFYMYFHTLESLLLGIFVGYLFSYIVLNKLLKSYKYNFILNLENLKKYFKYSYPIIFASIFTWGISFSDRYFIEYYLSTKDVAIYALLAMIAGIGQIVGQIYFLYVEPKILKKFEIQPKETCADISKYLKTLSFIFIFLTLIAAILPREIYTILIEDTIINNSYYFITFIILLLSIFLNVIHTAHHIYLKLFKKLNVLSYIYFIAFLVNIIGNIFIFKYGIIVASISTLVSYLVILFLQMIYINKFKPHKDFYVKNNI